MRGRVPGHLERRRALPCYRRCFAPVRRSSSTCPTHRAVALGRGEFGGADLVLGFEQYHVAAAVVDGGAARSRTFTLPELVELASAPADVTTLDVRERIALVTEAAHRRRVGRGTPAGDP